MTNESPNPNPTSSLRNLPGEIAGLVAAIVLVIELVTKQGPGPLPHTSAAIIVVIMFLGVAFWIWSKINSEKSSDFPGKSGSSSETRSCRTRLVAVINPHTAITFRLSFPYRMIGILVLLFLFVFSCNWTLGSWGYINLESHGISATVCKPSNLGSGLTVLVAHINQVSGTPSLLEERAFESIADGLIGDMEACLIQSIVSNKVQAQNLGQSVGATVVVWGRIDTVSEVYVTTVGLGDRLVFQLPSGDVLDNFNFQLDSGEQINVVAAFTVSLLLYRDNRVEEARKLLTGALSTAENEGSALDNLEPYLFLGFLFDQNASTSTPDFDEAIKAYSRAIELDPTYYRAYLNRAVAYINTDQIDKAISDYQYLINANSPFAQISRLNLAYIYKGKDDRSDAEEEFDEAIAHAPSDPNVYTSRGMAYLDWKELEKAIEDFKTARRLASQDPSRYGDLGLAQLLAGQISDAKDTYRDVCPHLTPEARDEIIRDLDQLAVDHTDLQPTLEEIKRKLDKC
jgi:tetratricopeptide (TPR) repeat protein